MLVSRRSVKYALKHPKSLRLSIDGAAVVQMLNPGAVKKIEEYALLIRSSYFTTSGQFEHVSCLDLVWEQPCS